MNAIAGYTFGTEQTAHSPLTLNGLELLKQTVLFTDEDEKYLRMEGEVLVRKTLKAYIKPGSKQSRYR